MDAEIIKQSYNHGSLFSGIGGFDLAAERVGWKNIFQVEIDDYCVKLLNLRFPDVSKYKDIKEFDGTKYRGQIDVISGGFPCQPFSHAGKRKGKKDDRYLWPEMFRVIKEIKPAWVVGENVAGFISMGLDESIADLESEGYEVQAFIIPACAVNAPHRRDRVWIVAYNGCEHGSRQSDKRKFEKANRQWTASESERSITSDRIRIIRNAKSDTIYKIGKIQNRTIAEPGRSDHVTCNPESLTDWINPPEHEGWQDNPGRFKSINPNRNICGLQEPWAEQQTAWDRQSDETIANAEKAKRERSYFTRTGRKNHTGRFEQTDPDANHAKTTRQRKYSGKILSIAKSKRPDIRNSDVTNTKEAKRKRPRETRTRYDGFTNDNSWNENWIEVAARFCRMDDGVSNRVDRLKSLGNSIVPQIAYEIFKAIDETREL